MAKRSNNEGSIYRNTNGRWRAQVSIDGKRMSHSGPTKSECQTWLKSILEENKEINRSDIGKQSFEEYLQVWLTNMEMILRPNTSYQYKLYADRHIYPRIGKIQLRDLKLPIIQEIYTAMNQQGYGVRTIRVTHNLLHHSLEDAMEAGYINRNPSTGAVLPKMEQKEMKFLNEDQVCLLLLAANGDRYEALYHLAIASGLRQSELLGLQWSDLDINLGTLKVERQLKRYFKDPDYFTQTKTKNGRRVVKLGLTTIEKLQEHRMKQNQDRILAGDRWKENHLIFPSSIGTPLNQMNLYKRFIGLLDKAGLPRVRFHDLRHTSASLLLIHKIPMIVVSRRLGHYKVSFTMDTYGHMVPEMQEEAATLIDNLISPVQVSLPRFAHESEDSHPKSIKVP
jgi:integrase